MGPIGCPATSVRNYHSTLRKIPKESKYHILCLFCIHSLPPPEARVDASQKRTLNNYECMCVLPTKERDCTWRIKTNDELIKHKNIINHKKHNDEAGLAIYNECRKKEW